MSDNQPTAWERLQVYLAQNLDIHGDKMRNILALARQVAMEEREACIRIAIDYAIAAAGHTGEEHAAERIAALIRGRSEGSHGQCDPQARVEMLERALQHARRFALSAIRQGVELEEFNPEEHLLIKEIDAALAYKPAQLKGREG